MCLVRLHLGEDGADYLSMSDDRENGERGRNRRPYVGDTGASYPNGRFDAGETGSCGPTQSTHERGNQMGYPTQISHGWESGNGFNARIQNIGKIGASCPTRMSHTGEFGASCLLEKQNEKTERSHLKERPLIEKSENRCHIGKSVVGKTEAIPCILKAGKTTANCPSIELMGTSNSHEKSIGTSWSHVRETGGNGYSNIPRIPACDGEEDWSVWINRFEAIADLRRWDVNRRLDAILPNLQGKVGEYAFTVLPRAILKSYRKLVAELNSVFGKVEIPRAFAAKFHKRVQGEEESIEEYAIALRCLYFKGYKHRDRQTREEDLVQRFLDELRDPDMRFAVEYHRKPTTLDEAVYHAVEYVELRSRIFEGAFTDKTFGEQRIEGCGEYNTDESAVDCCFQDDSQLDCISVDERSEDQTWKEAPSIELGHEAEVLNAIIQIKDSLQTLLFHNNLDHFRDDSMKMRQTETIECNSFKSELDVNQRMELQDNLTSSKLSNDIDQSEPVISFHSKQVDQGCICNASQYVPDAECGVLDRQSIGDHKTGERPENSYYTEVEMRDMQSIKDQMNETLAQELREHSGEREERILMDDQLLVPRNKFLPFKGETPPKCIPDRLGRMYAAVSVAA